MALRARAQRLIENESQAENSQKKNLVKREPIQLWQKLILRALVYIQTVRQEMVEEHLCSRSSDAPLPQAKNKKHADSKNKTSQPWTPEQIHHFGIGNPLPSSNTRKFLKSLSVCRHPASQLVMRAGKGSFWWACHDCGARWNRIDTKTNEPVCRVFVDENAPLLWAKNGMATYLPTQLPPPKSQLHRETIEVEIVWTSVAKPRQTTSPPATGPDASSSSNRAAPPERPRSASVRRRATESVATIENESKRQMEVDARVVSIQSDDSGDFEEINPVTCGQSCNPAFFYEDVLLGTGRERSLSKETKGFLTASSKSFLTTPRVDVAELYSPPRLTAAAPKFSLKPGAALDLTTGWDFTIAAHRLRATSWQIEEMRALQRLAGVHKLVVDMCAYGLRREDSRDGKSLLAKKPTGLLTNIAELAEDMTRRCNKQHAHAPLLGGTAAAAAKYTPAFVDAVTIQATMLLSVCYFIFVKRLLQRVDDLSRFEESGKFALSAGERWEIVKMHRTLGRPKNEVFLRALKHAGARADILEWVKVHFTCPTCDARPRPSPSRPGHLSRALGFNKVVGIDIMFHEYEGQSVPLLNMLDWGTGLQVVSRTGRKARDVKKIFAEDWIRHFGLPELVVADQGSEFAAEFTDYLHKLGVPVHPTDARSPWQNSRTERAGGIFKEKLDVTIADGCVQGDHEYALALCETAAGRNRYYNRSGFSPNQRVFGHNVRLPASLISDDAFDQELLSSHADDEVKRAWEIRDLAQAAWLKHNDVEALHRATRARSRTQDVKPITVGDWVYVWRASLAHSNWVGPGAVVAISPNGNSVWVSMKGHLWKCSMEQMRKATSEEHLGVEIIRELSAEMMDDIGRGNRTSYRDVAAEGPAPDEAWTDWINDQVIHAGPAGDVPAAAAGEAPVPPAASAAEAHAGTGAPSVADPEPHGEPSEMGDAATVASEPLREPSVSDAPMSIRVDEASGGSTPFRRQSTPQRSMPYPFQADQFQPLPAQPDRSLYFNVVEFDAGTCATFFDAASAGHHSVFMSSSHDGAKWYKNRQQNIEELLPITRDTFEVSGAEASFSQRDLRFYSTKAKTTPGQIIFSQLDVAEKKVFRASRDKEVSSLVDTRAVTVLSLEDSRAFAKEHPEEIIDSKFVDRYKPQESGDPVAKSRWCCVGWQDPHIHEIERSSPTPLSISIYSGCQVAASRGWRARTSDVKTAFLQSRKTTRKQKLACRQPRDERLPGLHPEQLLLLETEVYGLVSGPAWWRKSALHTIVNEFRYRINSYDKCVLTLDSEHNKPGDFTSGIIVIEVDDLFEAGDECHEAKMAMLRQRYTFGKVVDLMDCHDGTFYAGRRMKQLADFSFEIDMHDYVQNRLRPVDLSGHARLNKARALDTALSEKEITQLRGVIAGINWASREGRPDASAAASILPSQFPNVTVDTAKLCNTVVKHLKENKLHIKIHAIPEAELRHVVILDSAFDTSGAEKSQCGWLLGCSTSKLNQGEKAPLSLISWKSRRLRRKAPSSMMCESLCASAATGELEWFDAFMESIRFSKYDLRAKLRRDQVALGLLDEPVVIATDDVLYRDPNALVVMDAKALFDAIANEQASGEDKRSALEIAVIKESIALVRGRTRWVPHNFNPADGLTKLVGAHMEPLMQLLRTHHFQIREESEVLKSERQGDNRRKIGMNHV
ncbi:unnamed protein product [Polarella glacialis]|uniref:Integrase catalytic domain-containing protein n=1 Tax=Polarella glacialis TaxID=89957 RepID=A0A813K894_POLGL|nr:unnamed protein product [Polarella glacialis]